MHNKNLFIKAFILLTACFYMAAIQAEPSGYYRWKDAEGNTKLSDRPPGPGIKAEFIETPGSSQSRYTPPAATETKENTEQATAPEPQQMEALPNKDPERCKQAQQNMKAFEGFARIRVTDADGTQRLLTDDEKNVQIERSKKAIKENCE